MDFKAQQPSELNTAPLGHIRLFIQVCCGFRGLETKSVATSTDLRNWLGWNSLSCSECNSFALMPTSD